MYARVSKFRVSKDHIDEDIRRSEEVVTEAAKRLPGSRGWYYLVDREAGQTMSVTLWEDEQSMRASEEAADRIREEGATAIGGEIVSVERYEVALQPSDVMAPR